MVNLQSIAEMGYQKIWGEHSLTIGEIAGLLIGIALIYFGWLGSWSIWVGLIVIGISMALF